MEENYRLIHQRISKNIPSISIQQLLQTIRKMMVQGGMEHAISGREEG